VNAHTASRLPNPHRWLSVQRKTAAKRSVTPIQRQQLREEGWAEQRIDALANALEAAEVLWQIRCWHYGAGVVVGKVEAMAEA
jgi:hypothetical protein